MNKPTRQQIAKAARLATEQAAREWLWPEPSLLGLCGIASNALTYLFRYFDYPGTLVQGKYNASDGRQCHCWVESGAKIWDITATQFGKAYPKVLVKPKKIALGYVPEIAIKTEADLEAAFRGWLDQAPCIDNTKPIVNKALEALSQKRI